jgi:hypothetical protein
MEGRRLGLDEERDVLDAAMTPWQRPLSSC